MSKVSTTNEQEEHYGSVLKAPLRIKSVILQDGQHFLLTDNYMEAGGKVLCYKLYWDNLRQIWSPLP